jgi:uncharacterized protein (DUF362 family)
MYTMIKRTILFIFIMMMSSSAFADKSVVSVVKGADVDLTVRKAIELAGGLENKIKKYDRVTIKVSLDEAKPSGSGLVTNVDVVRTLVKMCKDAGARRITVADGSLKTNTYKAFEAAGYTVMAREEGAQLKDLDADIIWRAWLPDGDGYKKYSVATTVLNGEIFINVPVIKEEDENSPSLSLKNMLGIMDDKWTKRKLPTGEKLDTLILDMNLIKQSDLIVIDGTSYGGMIICSTDPVAADTVACKYLKISANKVNYIKMATEKGLGQSNMDDIEIKTQDL